MTKHKAAQSKSKGKINVPGVGEVEFTQETAYMLPDKFKEHGTKHHGPEDHGQHAGQRREGQSRGQRQGDRCPGHGQEGPEGRRPRDEGRAASSSLKDKGYELSLIGEDKVEGKEVVGIRVTKKRQKDVSLFFDKKTGMLAKVEHRTVATRSAMEVNEERIILEYGKNKDGIPMPKKVVVKHDGKQFLEAEVTEMKCLEKLDDSEFKK